MLKGKRLWIRVIRLCATSAAPSAVLKCSAPGNLNWVVSTHGGSVKQPAIVAVKEGLRASNCQMHTAMVWLLSATAEAHGRLTTGRLRPKEMSVK